MTAELEGSDLGPEQQGLVIAHFGVQVAVEACEGELQGQTFRCYLRANLPALVTGDRIIWRPGNQGIGVIVAQLDRHSVLARPDSRGLLKAVAANVDQIIIVFAPLPEPHANLIDRYLIATHDDQGHSQSLIDTYQQLGYKILTVSTYDTQGIEQLTEQLKGRISVFVGQSGVGKSSLVNKLLPDLNTRVGALSEVTGKGTHTTTTAHLFHFPLGGDLIDSPGIRDFALAHVTQQDVEAGFLEFADFLGRCRFRNCSHEHEPDCALLNAVANGAIHPARLASFKHILGSISEN